MFIYWDGVLFFRVLVSMLLFFFLKVNFFFGGSSFLEKGEKMRFWIVELIYLHFVEFVSASCGN